ncbi:MBL fold metallo-hydrolase [Haploplasma modicum]|uniref:hypothetical protein n=1 Tax=Haploplasma modicum TaxID=2150 RepID=UPI0005556899|nr:hypothetical protein [Haploplasma modicum]
MDKLEVYKVWANDESEWTKWVKPVMFANMNEFSSMQLNYNLGSDLNSDLIYSKDAICIVDLDGVKSLKQGLVLSDIGFRPIPLYNSVSSKSNKNAISLSELEEALYHGSYILKNKIIRKDANPAFLLDANRMSFKDKKEGNIFDNRWSIFKQDMPSLMYLKEKGITKIFLFTNFDKKNILEDLSHILYNYQSGGIKIINALSLKEIKVKKPMKYKSNLYRFLVLLGLRRNSAGGFGGVIPDAYSGGRTFYGGG